MAAETHAFFAHSQASGRVRGEDGPPRAAGAVDTLRVPPPSAHMGVNTPRSSATSGETPSGFGVPGQTGLPRTQANSPADLSELDCDVSLPVTRHDPGSGDVVVRTHDVRVVLGAVHEHCVELGVVDAPRPVTDVLAGLVAQAARQVDLRAVGVREESLRSDPVGVAYRHAGQAAAPRQGRQAVGGPVLVDQRLLRAVDDDGWGGGARGRRRPTTPGRGGWWLRHRRWARRRGRYDVGRVHP